MMRAKFNPQFTLMSLPTCCHRSLFFAAHWLKLLFSPTPSFNRCDANDEHHIVRMLDFFLFRKHLCLVFEKLDVNLFELLKVRGESVGGGLLVWTGRAHHAESKTHWWRDGFRIRSSGAAFAELFVPISQPSAVSAAYGTGCKVAVCRNWHSHQLVSPHLPSLCSLCPAAQCIQRSVFEPGAAIHEADT